MSRLNCRFSRLLPFVICMSLHAQNLRIEDFKSPSVACDYLIICPETFLAQGLKLAAHRNGYPLDDVQNAMVVTLNTIYEQFPFGDTVQKCFNIRYALQYASTHWAKKINYVVLLGDDSARVDGFARPPNSVGLMPTFYASVDSANNRPDTKIEYFDYFYQTIADTTPSFDSNAHRWDTWRLRQSPPAFALGRIPAESPEQCGLYVDKVIRYDTLNAKGAWMNHVELMADDTHQGQVPDPLGLDHMYNAENINECLNGFFIDKTYLSSFTRDFEGDHENAKKDFFNAVDKGIRWAIFFGHGHPDFLCAEKFLQYSDYSRFKNDSTPTVLFSFSCQNGDFLRKSHLQMNKSFLFKQTGGCIAYFAATQESYSQSNRGLARAIFTQNDSAGFRSLGKAVQSACCSVGDENMMYYLVLGDPAIAFRKSSIALTTSISSDANGAITLQTTAAPTADSPVFYRYQIAARDSPQCLDDPSARYTKDSVIAAFEGAVSGPISSVVPASFRTKKIHYSLYVWNDQAEARFDTLISVLDNIAVLSRSPAASVKPLFRTFAGKLAISLPGRLSSRTIEISVLNVKGCAIKEADAPYRENLALFDYSRLGLAEGNYFIRAVAGNRSFFGKIFLCQ